jgi:chromosome segregation ATPase
LKQLNRDLSDVNESIDQRSQVMDAESQSVNEQQLHINELNRTFEENRQNLIDLNAKIHENVQLLEEKSEQVDKLRQEFEAAYGLCSRAECVSSADDLARSMDTNVDPCQDFYRFACGGFPRNFPVPEGLESWNTSQQLDKDTRNLIKG